MKDLLNKIGITEPGHFTRDDGYVIDFENSADFNRAFSRLDKSDLVDEIEDSSVITLSVSNVMYSNDDYSLNLIADFDQDTYKLVVTKL